MLIRKNKRLILQRIRQKSFERKCLRNKVLKRRRVQYQEPREGLPIPRQFRRYKSFTPNSTRQQQTIKDFTRKKNYYLSKHLPINLDFLVKTKESPFFLEKIKREKFESKGVVKVPKVFSIIEEPEEGYLVLKKIVSSLLVENNKYFVLDYSECQKVELGSQILLDIILKDFLAFAQKCQRIDRNHNEYFPISVGGINIENDEVRKMIFSVGSPVTLKVREQKFRDIIPYKLCVHDNEKEQDLDIRMEQKELDTTEMVEYVIDCLERINKKLTPDKLDDLCTVIGEILINAEEHSSTKYRFSIGYFKEENADGKHFGIFRLVILNFGQTIYEKFKDENCPNKLIVSKMKDLSKTYTRKLFFQRKFEEENLWTLYALQEGVTSVSPKDYKRGNGSIRFIESFF